MDKNTHVYCTNCVHGEELIKRIMAVTDTPIENPEACNGCAPYNPEDSTRYELRPNYMAV